MVGAGGAVAVTTAANEWAPVQETERGFVIHTQETAPAQTKEVMDWYQQNFGFVPNLAGVMAESPALLRTYWQSQNNLTELGALTAPENNIVQMAIAVENECQYCVAGHTMAGKVFFGSSEEELNALRNESSLPEAKFDALRAFAVDVYNSKGRVTDEQLAAFYDAGYNRQQALDVVANVAAKVMTNYTNQIALTPTDSAIAPFAEGLPYNEDRKVITRDR